ncbi:hypothetical protein [Mucilaginibacter glaciei]|uniref:Uncharacterized protein n=1 Tax=Mucilaginibacter glaciei TaxID=2772109 RepID=A0A926S0I6_9SPHI|nr:hypothetical protein [Mucilaginibacter glaciei]MBD1392995.1 hypothetical protein [Mucilaginibacter glaciei]
MKNSGYLIAIVALSVILSCNQGKKDQTKMIDSLTSMSGARRPDQQCFVALFEKDSASLTLHNAPDGKVTGKMYIRYGEIEEMALENELNIGKINGEYKGDTLFANYMFTSGTMNKTIYSNPIALLLKKGTLILGAGVIVNYLGRSSFDKNKPLDFSKSRFHFKPVSCK